MRGALTDHLFLPEKEDLDKHCQIDLDGLLLATTSLFRQAGLPRSVPHTHPRTAHCIILHCCRQR